MGRALRERPIGIVVVPFVCGVNVGDLLCGTSIASIESIESIKSIEPIESVESSDSIESIESIQSIEPIESIVLVRADLQQKCVFPFSEVLFYCMFCICWVIFRPWDPSKKFTHLVRINLVQFSAPEFQ